VWQFRRQLTNSVQQFFVKGVLPLVGAITLSLCFYKSAQDMFAADYGKTSFHGVGAVFLIGMGSLLLGLLVMVASEASNRTFFRVGRKSATPVDVPTLQAEQSDHDLSPTY